jgi:SAM-dependent methyltransferase
LASDNVPSPIDFHDPVQARAWVEDTVRRRPSRGHFFAAFADALNAKSAGPIDILELGSGPGHLAESILQRCNVRRYVALDFSAAMHQLARERLRPFLSPVEFVQRDFRQPDLGEGLGLFTAAITMQAAHEMRHKRYLPNLPTFLRAAKAQLLPHGTLLYCDHYWEAGSRKNPALMATRGEQFEAVKQAGFSNMRLLLDEDGMALYSADNSLPETPDV